MPVVFPWRKRTTKQFGTVDVPYAEVEILRPDGAGAQRFALQVDTGAVVTLLRRSAAEVLGVDLDAGRAIELGAVGGGQTQAYVHTLTLKLADQFFLNDTPVAFAESEAVPNLLGRAGVLDRIGTTLDACLRETQFRTPWLREEHRPLREAVFEIDREIHRRIADHPSPGRVDEALKVLMNRSAQLMVAIDGLIQLHYLFEAPSLVRAMLEITMQVEYLLRDPVSRSESFLDFAWITKFKASRAALRHQNASRIAALIANSRLRERGEARLREAYERVELQFRRNPERERHWPNWYCMQVNTLAEQLGRGHEYDIWYKYTSAWIHGDASAVDPLPPDLLWFQAICYRARVLRLIADSKNMQLSDVHQTWLRALEGGVQ